MIPSLAQSVKRSEGSSVVPAVTWITAAAQIQSPALENPYATSVATKKKKKKRMQIFYKFRTNLKACFWFYNMYHDVHKVMLTG